MFACTDAFETRRSKMMLRSLFLVAAVAGTAIAAAPPSADIAATEGLQKVQSRTLDELYLLPDTGIASYRKILVDPPRAELQKGWLKQINSQRDVTRWLAPSDAQRITDAAAGAMQSAVAQAFTAKGYETVAEAGPGVLRLSPRVADLYVNAPDTYNPGVQVGIVRDTAGTATMVLEARDAVTGKLLGRVVDHGTAQEIRHFDRATTVSNDFWFEAVFRQWAQNVAKALEAAP